MCVCACAVCRALLAGPAPIPSQAPQATAADARKNNGPETYGQCTSTWKGARLGRMYDSTGLRVVRDEIEAGRDPGRCLFHLALCRRTRALSNIPLRLILDRHPLCCSAQWLRSRRHHQPSAMTLRPSCNGSAIHVFSYYPYPIAYRERVSRRSAAWHPYTHPPSYLETHMLKRLRQPTTAIMCSWPSCSFSASAGPVFHSAISSANMRKR